MLASNEQRLQETKLNLFVTIINSLTYTTMKKLQFSVLSCNPGIIAHTTLYAICGYDKIVASKAKAKSLAKDENVKGD